MRCTQCDFQNTVDALFCAGCGTAMPTARPYTPAHLPTTLLTSTAAVEGELKQVTVLFCDLVGSTAIAERIGPEPMHALLEFFFAVSMEQIHRYGGTINQFLGDGFMALFGAPVAHEDHARRAALAALDIQQAIGRRRSDAAGAVDETIAVRIGLNSGAVVVGRIGDHLRMDYTAVGDTTNLAARIQQLARPGTVYLTEATHRLIEPHVETASVGEHRLKGKRIPAKVYRLTGVRRHVADELRAQRPLGAPLVGRDPELRVLIQALDRLRRGHGSIAALLGEAGFGKSRLLAEVSNSVGEEVRWLEGRAVSFGSTFSFRPFHEILRTAAGIGDGDGEAEAAAKLDRQMRNLFPQDFVDVLPYLATLLSLPIAADLQRRVTYLDGHATGLQVFRSVFLLFERLARERPLVVVFEDSHWADESSLDLLEHILPLVSTVPLLLLLVGRPERDSAAARLRSIARMKMSDRYSEIVLSPLSESSSAALLDSLVPGDDTCTRFKHAAVQRAEGNPFYLEEIIRGVAADGLLEWNARERRWRMTREAEHFRLPDTLHDVISARIDRLDGDAKQLLKVASVIGRSFSYRVLKAASDAGDRLDECLQKLEAVELIREKRRAPELEYFFKHALIQEVTYDTILSARRRDLHRRVGECIERLFGDRLEDVYSVVAYHYARAEAWDKAQEYLFKAGDQAGRIAADAEALAHYQTAIAAYEKAFGDNWDPLQRSSLERKMGEALFRQGHHEQALDYVLTAKARLHRPLTAIPRSALGIRLAIGKEVGRRIGQPVLARFSTPAAPVDPLVLDEVARLGEVTGWIDFFLNPERFLLQALTGLAFFERHPHAIGLIYNHMSIGLICDAIPLFGLAERHHHEALAIATENGQPLALGHAHLGVGLHAHSRGHLKAALDAYETSATIFRDIGHIRGWGGATMMRAWASEDLGDFTRALSFAEAVSAVGAESSDPQVRSWGLQRRGVGRRHAGRVGEAMADLETSVALSRQIPDYAGVVQGLALLGLCHLDRGDCAQARRLVDEANRIRRERKLRGIWVAHAVLGAAEVSIAELDNSGPHARALRKRAGRACREARRFGKVAPHWLPAALRLQGDLHSRDGDLAAAQRYWRRSTEAAESVSSE